MVLLSLAALGVGAYGVANFYAPQFGTEVLGRHMRPRAPRLKQGACEGGPLVPVGCLAVAVRCHWLLTAPPPARRARAGAHLQRDALGLREHGAGPLHPLPQPPPRHAPLHLRLVRAHGRHRRSDVCCELRVRFGFSVYSYVYVCVLCAHRDTDGHA